MAFVNPLIGLAAACANTDQREVSAMVDSLIAPDYSPVDTRTRRSILNSDGVPLQLCLSSRTDKVSVRLIGDPCTGVQDPQERFNRSVKRLDELIGWSGAQTIARLAQLTIERTLPSTPDERSRLPYGALWLATGVPAGKGLALYTTLEWGEEAQRARWWRVQRWLNRILAVELDLAEQLGSLASLTWPISAGLEGSSEADAVAKIYLRFGESMYLQNALPDCFNSPEFASFSEHILAGRRIAATGTLLCLGFSVASGHLVSAKLDYCGHCVPRTPTQWREDIDQLSREFRIRSLPVQLALTECPVEVAFVGLGRNLPESYRLNLYLKASMRESRALE